MAKSKRLILLHPISLAKMAADKGHSTDYADPNKYAVDGRGLAILPSSGLASSIDLSPGHTYAPKQSSQGT
jgi:hypothetical protein